MSRNRGVLPEESSSVTPALSRTGVTWVTNFAAPYRIPVWQALDQTFTLSVVLLESERARSQDGRRGRDWAGKNLSTNIVHPRVARFARGERVFYALIAPWRHWPTRGTVLVLGGWESPAYWQLLLMAKLRGVPCIGFYESTIATNRYRSGIVASARRRFFKSLDAIVVPGIASERAVAALGVSADRVYRGFNAVDVLTFHRRASQARSSAPDRRGAGHRYVYVGQLIARKNLVRLIAAFGNQARADDSLTLIGGGEMSRELRELADQSDKAIEFREAVPNHELPALLGMYDTLVLVSHEEVWGLVVNEALAAGLHVVVSAEAGVSPSIKEMQGAYLVAPTTDDIAHGLARSREDWQGPIENPEILRYGPIQFAEVFSRAIQAVQGGSDG